MKLGDIMKLSKGNLVDIADEMEYTIAGVQNYGAGIVNRRNAKGVELTMKKYQLIKPNQLMWCKVDTKNGAFGITKKEHTNSLASTNMALAEIDTNKCHPIFIEYLFRISSFHEIITKASSGTTNRKYLTPSQLFENIEIPDFNLDEQLKWLEKVDSIINSGVSTELTHQRHLVKKLRQQLLQDAVKGKLVEQNKKDEPASELLKKIKAEKEKLIAEKKLKKEKELAPIKAEEIPFEIPVNWVWCRGEIVATYIDPQPSHRTPPESTDGIPYIAMSDIRKDGSLDFNSARKVSNTTLAEHQNRYKLKEGDFIFGKIGTIGKPVKLLAPFNYTLSANVILIQPERRIVNQDYLFYFLSSPAAEKNLIENKSTMSYPVFGMGKARNMPIPLPPLSEQIRIVQKLDELMQYCNSLEASIKQSAAQNERLLQQVLREALRKEPVEV
jgi:type I restriction enzyme S subunit